MAASPAGDGAQLDGDLAASPRRLGCAQSVSRPVVRNPAGQSRMARYAAGPHSKAQKYLLALCVAANETPHGLLEAFDGAWTRIRTGSGAQNSDIWARAAAEHAGACDLRVEEYEHKKLAHLRRRHPNGPGAQLRPRPRGLAVAPVYAPERITRCGACGRQSATLG